MVLSDVDIKKYIADKKIVVHDTALDKTLEVKDLTIGSCSIDLRLGYRFRIFEHTDHPYVDLKEKKSSEKLTREVKLDSKNSRFIMHPGEFVLASTMEWLEISDDILGRLEGRSSLGRLGLIVHSTASVFDPGWRGVATMELGNLGVLPVALYPGLRICSMTFETLLTPSSQPYYKKKGNKYAGQRGPDQSKIWVEEAELGDGDRQMGMFGTETKK